MSRYFKIEVNARMVLRIQKYFCCWQFPLLYCTAFPKVALIYKYLQFISASEKAIFKGKMPGRQVQTQE